MRSKRHGAWSQPKRSSSTDRTEAAAEARLELELECCPSQAEHKTNEETVRGTQASRHCLCLRQTAAVVGTCNICCSCCCCCCSSIRYAAMRTHKSTGGPLNGTGTEQVCQLLFTLQKKRYDFFARTQCQEDGKRG